MLELLNVVKKRYGQHLVISVCKIIPRNLAKQSLYELYIDQKL